MATVIESPNEINTVVDFHNNKLFLAGGITNCPDWQSEIILKLKNIKALNVYNPRRANFPMDNPNAAEEQITWEYKHLRDSNIILFWFAKGSINPIVLYELGRWGNSTSKKIIIGIDPEYERAQDVSIQTMLSRPEVPFVHTIKDAVKEIKKALK